MTLNSGNNKIHKTLGLEKKKKNEFKFWKKLSCLKPQGPELSYFN